MTNVNAHAHASLRLGLPDLFDQAKFEQVLILTYGADLEFYERVLRRHFGWYRNQIVLGDGHLLARDIQRYKSGGSLRHLNRSWIAAPVASNHSVHAKAIMLAGPESGLLLVGSGNLNMTGYARNGECFTPYRWSEDSPDDLSAFTAVRDLTEQLRDRDLIDDVAVERLRVFWHAYDWWNEAPAPDGPVRHNLDVPLGRQLVDRVGLEAVTELTVATPFHDPKCAALRRLVDQLHPKRLRVLVQRDRCSVDPDHLTAVLAAAKGTAHSIAAFGDETAYLHAKIIHVRTTTRDICLTGSANCSMVALWNRNPAANIELGNLAEGAIGTFDDLFARDVVTISKPITPSSLNVSIKEDDDPDASPAEVLLQLRSLVWRPPMLSGELSVVIATGQEITLSIDGATVAAEISFDPAVAGWTRFSARLTGPADIVSVDEVAVVTVLLSNGTEVSAVPYQPDRLKEQDRRRVDVDRLQQAARFEIEDPDLYRALAALEGILIGESIAAWAKARVEPDGDTADDDGASIAWDEIDWATVRRSARHLAYGGSGVLGVAGSDLAAYLDALSAATRNLIEPLPVEKPVVPIPDDSDEDKDEDESDLEGGVEGVDPDDIEDTIQTARRQSAAARNRRLLRNFIRRNLRALEHPGFRTGAGPGVVILNIIILNWLCWWVATSDEERPADLVDERLRLWILMWGSDGSAGYFASLAPELQDLTLETFEAQHFESVLIASITDSWSWIENRTDKQYRMLRRVLRSAITQSCWQVTATHIIEAARLTNARPTTVHPRTPQGIGDVLWEVLSEPLGDDDSRVELAAVLGVSPADITFATPKVSVEPGVERSVKEAKLATHGIEVDAESVRSLLAVWQGAESLPYYRLRWVGGVAFYAADATSGWVYDTATEETTELGVVEPSVPPWTEWVEQLLHEVDTRATAAA